MKFKRIVYRGFEILIEKIKNYGCYMSAIRLSDSWILFEDYNESINTIRDAVEECKFLIDKYYENPDEYKD